MPIHGFSLQLYQAAIAGAAPGPVTQRAAEALNLGAHRRIWLLAFGKAAPAMTGAIAGVLDRSRGQIVGGIMVTPHDSVSPVHLIDAVRGDHPTPGQHSFAAAASIGEIAARCRGNDAVVVLVSGGASSLIAAPVRGLNESDLSRSYEILLGSGLDITAMNAVRKRFCQWAGGRLALALAPAEMVCLAMSDVPTDDPSTIGSGPCSPDTFTITDVLAMVDEVRLFERLPLAFQRHLLAIKRGSIPDTPRASHPAFARVLTRVIGTNRLALDAAAARARDLGASVVDVAAAPLTGEASARGEQIARELVALRAQYTGAIGPVCRIWGGETTVTLGSRGSAIAVESPGAVSAASAPTSARAPAPAGGRCQELALAAARVLADAGNGGAGITLLAAGTDGRDGPTDAAGACVDATTWGAIRHAGIDPERALARHESYQALDGAGALIRTGPTGTNVMDIVIGLIEPT
ncbi:MAG: glycerate kinase type-2 family protein [Gemmatimonadaceae bacterium]